MPAFLNLHWAAHEIDSFGNREKKYEQKEKWYHEIWLKIKTKDLMMGERRVIWQAEVYKFERPSTNHSQVSSSLNRGIFLRKREKERGDILLLKKKIKERKQDTDTKELPMTDLQKR